MNRVALLFADGTTFFIGIVVAPVCLGLPLCPLPRWVRLSMRVPAALGLILVALSSTPARLSLLILWLLSGTVCMAKLHEIKGAITRRQRALFVIFVVVSVVVCAMEIPYHLAPSLPDPKGTTLSVVGDSLCMGADAQDLNWPELLGKALNYDVANLSFGGAKVGSALSNAERIDSKSNRVFIEVGGNDLLYGTDGDEYEEGLKCLLEEASRPGRTVVVFELPLPPFYNHYSLAQRRQAKEFGATLLPKRYLADVLGAPGATTDGLHLSHKGHALMAEALAALFTETND